MAESDILARARAIANKPPAKARAAKVAEAAPPVAPVASAEPAASAPRTPADPLASAPRGTVTASRGGASAAAGPRRIY